MDRGIRPQMVKGILFGLSVVDFAVILYDGKVHSVDSSDVAFQIADALALREAATKDNIGVLELIDRARVTVEEAFLGPILTGPASCHGQVLGSDANTKYRAITDALISQLELTNYPIDLRGLA